MPLLGAGARGRSAVLAGVHCEKPSATPRYVIACRREPAQGVRCKVGQKLNMSSIIPTSLKQKVQRLLKSRGYVVMRQSDYDRLVGNSYAPPPAQPKQNPSASNEAVVLRLPDVGPSADPNDLRVKSKRFLELAHTVIEGKLPGHAAALFASIYKLSKSDAVGDVVNCGDGAPFNLALIATAFMTIGDISRNLIDFDVSGDPSHRPEVELRLWGADWSDLIDGRGAPRGRSIKVLKPLPR